MDRGRGRTLSSSTASLPPAWRRVCGGTQVTQREPVSRKPEFFRIETCGEPLGSLSVHTTHLPVPLAFSTRKSSCLGNLEIVSVAGPLAGQRAYESGIAGHNGGETPERSLGSVKDIGQLVTDVVERWGEKRGWGPASGSLVLMGERMALVSNMPGMVSRGGARTDAGGPGRGVPPSFVGRASDNNSLGGTRRGGEPATHCNWNHSEHCYRVALRGPAAARRRRTGAHVE